MWDVVILPAAVYVTNAPYRDELDDRLTIDCAGVTLLLCIALRLRLGVPPLKLSALLYMPPLLPAKLHDVSKRPQ